jgi:hypothetical protein
LSTPEDLGKDMDMDLADAELAKRVTAVGR